MVDASLQGVITTTKKERNEAKYFGERNEKVGLLKKKKEEVSVVLMVEVTRQ